MKTRISEWLIVMATFVALMFVVSGLEAGKPDKPPKPDKTTGECIVFSGQLETAPDSEIVEGCCPNAGPWPAYSMILDLLDTDGIPYQGQYDGQLFINGGGSGPNQDYKVQFWSWDSDEDEDIPGVGDIFFEITGGVVDYDRKSKFLTVSFSEEKPTLWLYDNWDPNTSTGAIEAPVLPVSFDLFRSSDLSNCTE